MAYSPTYDADDLSAVVIDFIGTYAAQLVTFAALIALIALFVWAKKKGAKVM